MAEVANANEVRILAYAASAAICFAAWRRERVMADHTRPDLWPRLWLLTALLLGGFAIARFVGAAELLADLGRDEARRSGYYEARRGFQALLVGSISLAWAASTVVAVWRVPERRRRYLPAVLVVLAIAGFAAVRLVSLHHIDQVLYNRTLFDVRPVAPVELGLLALFAAVTVLTLGRGRTPAGSAGPGVGLPGASRSAPP